MELGVTLQVNNPFYMESLELESVELYFGKIQACSYCEYFGLGMCGKFSFTSCCGGSNDSEQAEDAQEKAPSSRTRRRRRSASGNSEHSNEDRRASTASEIRDPSTINVNMVAPHTMKLLTDIREIKGYKQSELDNDELQKALQIHGDILARLENPTKYT